jgi:hypothetical protein
MSFSFSFKTPRLAVYVEHFGVVTKFVVFV